MPLTRIEIEQVDPIHWVAEVEHGGASSFRRVTLRGDSMEGMIKKVWEELGCKGSIGEDAAPSAPAKAAPKLTAHQKA